MAKGSKVRDWVQHSKPRSKAANHLVFKRPKGKAPAYSYVIHLDPHQSRHYSSKNVQVSQRLRSGELVHPRWKIELEDRAGIKQKLCFGGQRRDGSFSQETDRSKTGIA